MYAGRLEVRLYNARLRRLLLVWLLQPFCLTLQEVGRKLVAYLAPLRAGYRLGLPVGPFAFVLGDGPLLYFVARAVRRDKGLVWVRL